ncbi:MAG: thiolase family protein [Novosphingobium sp.]|nr:thiolase family protein [Novosphingobium sp.]
MRREDYPERKVAITGIGQSKVGRPSNRSALQLTLDACLEAIADAGISVDDVDGLICHPGKSSEGGGIAPVGTVETMMALGIRPVWTNPSSHEGPGHMAAIFQAIMAIAAGLCRHVLCFRTVAQASARVASRASTLLAGSQERVDPGNNAYFVPFHAYSPVNLWALYARAYMDKYGATEEQLGWVAVNGRRHAVHNPNALYRKPITIEEYLGARMISSPLRLFDCDSHIDGSTAILLSAREVARDLRNPPIEIEAIGMSMGAFGEGLHIGDFTMTPAWDCGTMLWNRTDWTPQDVDCAQIYDGFSIHVWLWLEAVRLCQRGEAASFIAGGARTAVTGELPLNTSGGQLSAGRFHGFGHIHEACVQLWGRGGERQVPGARTCLTVNGGYGYGAMLMKRE